MDEKGMLVLVKRIRTDVFDIGHLFKNIEDETNDGLALVMEATGFYFWIYDCIVAPGHDVMVVHPTKVKAVDESEIENRQELRPHAGGTT